MRKPRNGTMLLKCLLLTSLLTIGVGCTTTEYVYKGALPAKRPILQSVIADRNDKTGELGLWMDFVDARELTAYAEYNEGIRDSLQKQEKRK